MKQNSRLRVLRRCSNVANLSNAKQVNMKQKEFDLPDKVSWRVVDAWVAVPPCDPSISHPYCHVQCPYFYECYPEEYEEDESVYNNYNEKQD